MELTDRGQTWIVDAVLGIIILAGGLSLAIVSSGVTPAEVAQPKAGVSDEQIKQEVDVALAASARDGSLKRTMLAWDNSSEQFAVGTTGTARQGWLIEHPDNEFGKRLQTIENRYGVDINVRMAPRSNASAPDVVPEPFPVIKTGVAQGDNQIITEPVTISESDWVQSSQRQHDLRTTPVMAGQGGQEKVGNSLTYPVPEGDDPLTNTHIYNIVDVQVVVYDD